MVDDLGPAGFSEADETSVERSTASILTGNRFDRMEWAGAFGDLGTLVPFVVAYVAVVKVDPCGVLLSFGLAMVICGLVYRTPFPVQPMKAIGAVAATQAAGTAITQSSLYAADLVTGVVWLTLGLTGWARQIARFIPRCVLVGIVLGLGMSFMIGGTRLMSEGWGVASFALIGTLLLLTNRTVPAMFLLLLVGIGCGAWQNPSLLRGLLAAKLELRLPAPALTHISWNDWLIGTAFLALPQLPLTLGNAIMAVREENNTLFPDRAVTDNLVATSTGVMNLGSALLGGVPMCHGAGGMAGHVAFGARSGGAPIILGVILVCLAVFFSGSIQTLFGLFAHPVLGVVLFLMGAQLAVGSCDFGDDKAQRFITLATAAFSMWNVGLAFAFGLTVSHIDRRGWLRLAR
jgi:MFS superfamily sulfate permease-like transporter